MPSENMSLLDVQVLPVRSKMTKNWESDSDDSKDEPEVRLSPVKITTIEQFYNQRQSKMNPVNLMLSK